MRKSKPHDRLSELTLKNHKYKSAVFAYLSDQLKSDVGDGDITTDICLKNVSTIADFKVVFKEDGILAGIEELKYFFNSFPAIFGDLSIKCLKKDGDFIKKGISVLNIKGNPKKILKIERTMLNFLSRMSGIATFANRLVKKARLVNKNINIAATRKTLLGLLDKKAAAVGGALTHRLSLDDAVLVKDNHLRFLDIPAVFKTFSALPKIKFVEIEVCSEVEAVSACSGFKEMQKNGFSLPCFVMLDNVSPQKAKKIIETLKKMRATVGIEISGGINEKNITAYACTGADILSSGAITHSAPALDISLD